jgi:type IV secretory pathway TrbL component
VRAARSLLLNGGYQPMKMLAFLLAIICAVVAVMYYTMPAGSLPTFMPGYVPGAQHVHMKHAIAAAVAAVVLFVLGLYAGRSRSTA